MRFGTFVPQGWRMDLREIADPIEQFEAMTAVAKAADDRSVGLDLGLRPLPHRAGARAGDDLRVLDDHRHAGARHQRVNIGQMVGCNGYRNPALYAKIASTVDVASHGRLYAGIGAGWYEHEWRAYGYEWTDTPHADGPRSGRRSQIIHKMWTEDYPELRGQALHDRRADQ